MNKSETRQNYLEAVYIIEKEKGYARSIDVAEYLGFSRATVSIALKQFQNEGYIATIKNNITLTEKGKLEAEKMYERHELVANMLIRLGVPKDIAYHDSCLIEHDLSDESFAAIKEHFLNKTKNDR